MRLFIHTYTTHFIGRNVDYLGDVAYTKPQTVSLDLRVGGTVVTLAFSVTAHSSKHRPVKSWDLFDGGSSTDLLD